MKNEEPQQQTQEKFKYLAIKNWDKYQMKDRKQRDIKLYIKDYCGKDIDDPEYNALTFYQRYLWDACCRLRGRSGKNLCNDPVWLARAVGALPEERHCLPQALGKLVACGFLIPTNQQVGLSDSKPESEPKTETETKDANASGSPLPSGEKSNTSGASKRESNNNPNPKTSTDVRDWSEYIPGCPLTPDRIRDCIRYQLDVKKNQYFIKRMSRGYVLQEWKRLDADTPEDYVYDSDPMLVEKMLPGENGEPEVAIKVVSRKPKNAAERALLQKTPATADHNRKWLFKEPCPYGCKGGTIRVFPKEGTLLERVTGEVMTCRCVYE